MHLKVSPKGCHIFERLQGFKCIEESIDGTAPACGFLEKKDIGASTGLRQVLEECITCEPRKFLVLEGA